MPQVPLPSFRRPSREGGSAVAGSFRPFVLARRPHRTVATERSGEDGSGQNLFSGGGGGGGAYRISCKACFLLFHLSNSNSHLIISSLILTVPAYCTLHHGSTEFFILEIIKAQRSLLAGIANMSLSVVPRMFLKISKKVPRKFFRFPQNLRTCLKISSNLVLYLAQYEAEAL